MARHSNVLRERVVWRKQGERWQVEASPLLADPMMVMLIMVLMMKLIRVVDPRGRVVWRKQRWQVEASPPLADRRPALRPKSPRLDGAEAEADPPGAGGGAPVLVSWTRWTRGSVSPGNPTICVRLCVETVFVWRSWITKYERLHCGIRRRKISVFSWQKNSTWSFSWCNAKIPCLRA